MIDKLNNNFILKNGGYSNYEDTTGLARHRWYYYKEGFSPNLVEQAIAFTGINKNDLIIDPFNGSGTTTLTASLNGYKSLGIEVNPFTSFLADTKTKNVNTSDLKLWAEKLLVSAEKPVKSPLIGYSTFSDKSDGKKWLFNNSVLNSFEGGWQLTEGIHSPNMRKLARLALISAAMQNCNARRDGKCLRYSNWGEKKFEKDTFLDALKHNLNVIKSDIEEKPVLENPIILKGDCRKILSREDIPRFKLCITSPPYLNTFDYTDIYRPELFLGKFIDGNENLYKLRLTTVRSHVQAKWKSPILNDFGTLYMQYMKHINQNPDKLMHKFIPTMIQAYFEDMFNILKLLKSKATKDAQVWLVVSNSAYANKEIPVDLIIGDIGTQAGWYLKEIGVLRNIKKRMTKYSPSITSLRESVIILSNNK